SDIETKLGVGCRGKKYGIATSGREGCRYGADRSSIRVYANTLKAGSRTGLARTAAKPAAKGPMDLEIEGECPLGIGYSQSNDRDPGKVKPTRSYAIKRASGVRLAFDSKCAGLQ